MVAFLSWLLAQFTWEAPSPADHLGWPLHERPDALLEGFRREVRELMAERDQLLNRIAQGESQQARVISMGRKHWQ